MAFVLIPELVPEANKTPLRKSVDTLSLHFKVQS